MILSKEQREILGKFVEGEWARLAFAIDREATESGKEKLRKAQVEMDELHRALTIPTNGEAFIHHFLSNPRGL